jgi:hypothetical protein
MDYSSLQLEMRSRLNGECDISDGLLRLSIDTSVSQNGTKQQRPSVQMAPANVDGRRPPPEAVRKADTTKSTQEIHGKPRAWSESVNRKFSLGDEIYDSYEYQSHRFGDYAPPMSSPHSRDVHNPYSTSAHIYPADESATAFSVESPPSTMRTQVKRPPPSARHTLSPKSIRIENRAVPEAGLGRSMSYSFGTPTSFVDASSYDSVPDSPAKMVSPVLRQMD